MTAKARINLQDNEGAMSLGLVLFHQLYFSQFFQKKDLGMEPTVPQKLMFCDTSKKILLSTSRNVAKSVSIIGRSSRDVVTYLPTDSEYRRDEILIFTPAESHLGPLVGRIFDLLESNIAFKSLVKTWNRTTDKPLIETKNGLKVHFRIEGVLGSDVNMASLHPFRIYGDECSFSNFRNHRSRAAGAMPNTTWLYAGVPNGVRGTPFYALDNTKEGSDWSRHKCTMTTANPLFLKSKKYRREMIAMFGGKHSPDYITQVLGQWGDEAKSSFPTEIISFDTILNGGKKFLSYYPVNLSGSEIRDATGRGDFRKLLRVPSVDCLRAVIGWDFGQSPDPTNFMVVIQTEEGGPWKTYARISLYSTPLHMQLEVLKVIWRDVLNGKCVLISSDNKIAITELLKEDNAYLYGNKAKDANPGGTIEYDTVDSRIVLPEDDRNPIVIQHRDEKKVIKEWRKYWLTEMMRRYMMNAINGTQNNTRLILGYDSDLESEFIGTVERRTKDHTIYEVGRNSNKVNADQIVDSLRYAVDCIMTVEATKMKSESVDMSSMLSAFGWTGKKKDWASPW